MPSPNIDENDIRNSIQKVYFSGGSADYEFVMGQYTLRKHARSTSSVRTPGFKHLPARLRPINHYSFSDRLVESSNGPVTTGRVSATPGASGRLELYCGVNNLGYNTDHIPWESDEMTQCSQKLLGSLNTSKTNSGVAIAEAHKTAAMVAKTATRIGSAISALRKLDFPRFTSALGITAKSYQKLEYGRKRSKLISTLVGPEWDLMSRSQRRYTSKKVLLQEKHQGRILDFASDTWLEFSYGWKPLLQDVYSHAEALAQVMTERSTTAVRKSFSTVSLNRTLSEYTEGENLWNCTKTTNHVRSVRMGVAYTIEEGLLSTAATFGLNNPAVIAWELVPFSFVVDWFLPIGQALESLTATSGLVFLNGFVSTKVVANTTTRVGRNGKTIDTGGYLHQGGGGVITATDSNFNQVRYPLTSFPSPTFPRWKDPRSFTHAASAIALLQSIFLRK